MRDSGPKHSVIVRGLLMLSLLASVSLFVVPARAQEQPAPQASGEAQKDDAKKDETKKDEGPKHPGIAKTLVEETQEADSEEENANLKHSTTVQWLARKAGLTVHQAHLAATTINFAIIVVIFVWAGRKFLPGMFKNRTASIQQALEEARAASQDANRRLSDIENRLRQLDVEIGRMQSAAETEAAAEEVRIKIAAEEDIRKVVQSAEQEITAAAKQARRELSVHTSGLAIALARKQIDVDPNTDQILVRTFASKLTGNGGKDGN